MTNSKSFWDSIKDKEINLFGMQTKLDKVCAFVEIDDEKCYLIPTIGAVLPALENMLGRGFTFEQVEKYIIVTPTT